MRRCILIACLALLSTITPCLSTSNAQPKPGCICTAIYDPVCGSDGRDYSSACQADCAGVTVASHGMCSAAAAGSDTPTSSSSTVDPTAIQLPGGISVHVPTTDTGDSAPGCLCTSIAVPVCGEDGQTYTNDCQASCAGIQVASEGVCETQSPPAAAPVPAAAQEERPKAAPAQAAAGQGCVCPALYDPVCGADGKTYPSACNAECAGVNVASKGMCEPGTPAPAPSPAASSAPAPAAPTQDACTCPMIYAPVCTAKGVTRSNKCVAGCHNETVVSEGSCGDADEAPANATAKVSTPAAAISPATSSTAKVSNVSAPAVDKTDTTVAAVSKPPAAADTTVPSSKSACDSCEDLYSPVCGTNGVTYSNSCEAECLNKVQVAFAGVCASRGASAAPATAANTTSNSTPRSSASGVRTGGTVFGGFAVAAVTLLSMLWL